MLSDPTAMEPSLPLSQSWSAALPRRPAALAAAVFIGGIAFHASLAHRPFAWLACAFVAAGIAVTVFRRPAISCAILGAAIFFCGVAAAQIEAFYFPHNDISAYVSD